MPHDFSQEHVRQHQPRNLTPHPTNDEVPVWPSAQPLDFDECFSNNSWAACDIRAPSCSLGHGLTTQSTHPDAWPTILDTDDDPKDCPSQVLTLAVTVRLDSCTTTKSVDFCWFPEPPGKESEPIPSRSSFLRQSSPEPLRQIGDQVPFSRPPERKPFLGSRTALRVASIWTFG